MKFSNLIILILVFTILFNFTFETTSNASSIVAGSIAAKYGATKAAELIVFILAAATAGVTFNALDEANALYDNYQMWGNIEPPPNNDWKNVLKELLRFGILSSAVGALITNIRDYFQSIGSVEGDNYFYDVINGVSNDISYSYFVSSSYSNGLYGNKLTISINGSQFQHLYSIHSSGGSPSNTYIILNNISITKSDTNAIVNANISFRSGSYSSTTDVNKTYENIFIDISDPIEYIDNPKYIINSDNLIITNRDPFDLPSWYQPNILDIVPTKEVTTPQGIAESIYEGTEDELFEELVNTITFDDINNSQPREPYTLTETQSGIKIGISEVTETPFPDIDNSPIEDTSEFQGENIGLLKSIVNWLSNINNNITELPNKIGNLFYNPDNIESIDFSPITNVSISDKFPFSIPWDLKDSVEMLASEGKAPKWEVPIVTEVITIDMAEFEEIASIMRVFNTLLFVVALIILTRRLI